MTAPRTLFALAACGLFSNNALASEVGTGAHPFGLGVMLGYPSGISAKYYLSDRVHAIDAALATWDWNFGDGGGAYVHASYLIHPGPIDQANGFILTWHFGVGGALWSHYRGWGGNNWQNDTAVGVRVPIALDFDLTEIPLQFFAEASLNTFILPGTFIDVGIALGARYYF